MTTLKVSKTTEPGKLAGALAHEIRKADKVVLDAVGAMTVNTAVKALAIARGFLTPLGYDLVFIPTFTTAEIAGTDRTAIRFIVKKEVI